jgi:hypothetical protein
MGVSRTDYSRPGSEKREVKEAPMMWMNEWEITKDAHADCEEMVVVRRCCQTSRGVSVRQERHVSILCVDV